MRIAIMQPYLFPYIGYFQLINAVDKFVVYDNIQYIKNGWIQRNRILVNGKDEYISLNVKKASFDSDIRDRYLLETCRLDNKKIIRRIEGAYKMAPYYQEAMPTVLACMEYPDDNLFNFIFNSLRQICGYLDISTPFVISSSLEMDHTLKSQDRVLGINRCLGADEYINPIGGLELYSKDDFAENGINIMFLKAKNISYNQFKNDFVPFLSILDVIMFNSKEKVHEFLNEFDLI